MQTLKELNVQKSLDVLMDFHEAVPPGVFDKNLRKKKVQAELALKHIGEFFRDDRGDKGCCESGQKSQDNDSSTGG